MMIEVLLLIIIILFCASIYGYSYYLLKIKQEPHLTCPECPDVHVTYPKNKECPKTNKVEKTPLYLGIKIKTENKAVKKLIKKLNDINELTTSTFCSNSSLIKDVIRKELAKIKDDDLWDVNCKDLLKGIKKEIKQHITDKKISGKEDVVFNNDIYYSVSLKIIEISEIILPKEICDNKTLDRKQMQRFIFDMIDAFCDGNKPVIYSIDEHED
jgi:flagellar basal body-associated protein FliL